MATWFDEQLWRSVDKISYRFERNCVIVEGGFFDKNSIATHRG